MNSGDKSSFYMFIIILVWIDLGIFITLFRYNVKFLNIPFFDIIIGFFVFKNAIIMCVCCSLIVALQTYINCVLFLLYSCYKTLISQCSRALEDEYLFKIVLRFFLNAMIFLMFFPIALTILSCFSILYFIFYVCIFIIFVIPLLSLFYTIESYHLKNYWLAFAILINLICEYLMPFKLTNILPYFFGNDEFLINQYRQILISYEWIFEFKKYFTQDFDGYQEINGNLIIDKYRSCISDLISKNIITKDDILDLEPIIFVGITSLILMNLKKEELQMYPLYIIQKYTKLNHSIQISDEDKIHAEKFIFGKETSIINEELKQHIATINGMSIEISQCELFNKDFSIALDFDF